MSNGPGIYHVYVDLDFGGQHRYAISAVDAEDAKQDVLTRWIPRDYPNDPHASVVKVRLARPI